MYGVTIWTSTEHWIVPLYLWIIKIVLLNIMVKYLSFLLYIQKALDSYLALTVYSE
jgi:hypothetical protein